MHKFKIGAKVQHQGFGTQIFYVETYESHVDGEPVYYLSWQEGKEIKTGKFAERNLCEPKQKEKKYGSRTINSMG